MTPTAFVAVLIVHLRFPDAGSLKAKRKDLASVKAQLHGRFGAAVAEIDHHDAWQRATLAAVLTGRAAGRLESAADRIERWLDGRFPECVRVERTLASLEDLGA